jgi:hypothetical protein
MSNPANDPAPPAPAPPRRGMAIASMVISIVSVLTCGGLIAGPILGLVFGIIALRRANREPAIFGGKGMAIAGIVMSLVAPVMLVACVVIAIPNMKRSERAARETAAISNLRTIGTAQATFQVTKGNGAFTDLATLGNEGLVDAALASGQKGGYQFTSTPSEDAGGAPIFDTTAVPLSTGTFGTGNRSFGSNETYVIYEADGAMRLKGTRMDRVPAGGRPLQ